MSSYQVVRNDDKEEGQRVESYARETLLKTGCISGGRRDQHGGISDEPQSPFPSITKA